MPPAPGSSAALRSTYAGYIQELQQSGASMGNRLALHAGRQQTVQLSAEHCKQPVPGTCQDCISALSVPTAQCTMHSSAPVVVSCRHGGMTLTACMQCTLGSCQELHCRGQVSPVLLMSATDTQAAHSSSKAEAVCSSLVSVSVYTANNEHDAYLVDKQKNKQKKCCVLSSCMSKCIKHS